MQWYGKKTDFNRFLGQVDQDDPTNLPVGCAAVSKNTEFARDSGGPTCANMRAGVNLAIQAPDPSPITGLEEFIYQPELATDVSFQRPSGFQLSGTLFYENPVGTGRTVKYPAGNLTPPAEAHMLAAHAANKLWAAFATLGQNGAATPASAPACIDPKALTVNPLGMKPFGWTWQPNTPVYVGEVCTPPTPSTGNGHTYRCTQAGTTAAAVGAGYFPTAENAIFDDGTAIWEELTLVLANRLPAPAEPALALAGGGTWGANLDIYAVITLENTMGETLPSTPELITTLAGATTVQVTIPTLASMAGWIQGLAAPYVPTGANVYIASVAHGSAAPPLSAYLKANSTPVALGGTFNSTAAGSGAQPPSLTTARVVPGQLPTPDVEPTIERDPAGGTFAAGRDVYVAQTYTNAVGETKLGPASSIINTNLNDGVQVTVAVPEDDQGNAEFTIASVGIYEADVPTGDPAPAMSEFQLVGYYQPGAMPVITTSATGQNAPTSNGTGPGGAIAADTATGGINGTQGFRYAAVLFMNSNETVSGFTTASVQKYDVDEDGWELAAFNIATGPAWVVGRLVSFTVADGTPAGPFDWIGVIDLLVPSQNFVYPATIPSGEIDETATAILDNVTTSAVFNFDDDFLLDANDVTDRLRVMAPPTCCRIDYLGANSDCIALTGVNGLNGGGLLSVASDYESFYSDTSPLPIRANGENCYGFTDKYKGIIFALRSGSGWEVTPNTGDPSSWSVRRRWGSDEPGRGTGPCGFRAWDACGKFIFWIHRSGAYKYDQEDDLMSKEVPREWATINWAACSTFECRIDEDTHQVLLSVAVGASAVPNKILAISYIEGWQNPLHFSTYSGKEISMDAARRWSFQDIQCFTVRRMNRTLAPGPAYLGGPDWTTVPDSSFAINQLLFGSSAADGGVHARTPGIFADNGAGIDWQYETVSASNMQAWSKPEGINLNAVGRGVITASFIGGRKKTIGPDQVRAEVKLRDIVLDADQNIGITRKAPVGSTNEFWRIRFTNGKQANAWCSLKAMQVYTIPVSAGRDAGDRR